MPVVELSFRNRQVMRLGFGEDLAADRLDAGCKRRDIWGEDNGRRCLGHRVEHAIREPIDETNQEMPRSHRRVANLEFEDPGGGIERRQIGKPSRFRTRLSSELIGLRGKAGSELGYQRADSALDYQSYQLLGRVVASRALARSRVLSHLKRCAFLDG